MAVEVDHDVGRADDESFAEAADQVVLQHDAGGEHLAADDVPEAAAGRAEAAAGCPWR